MAPKRRLQKRAQAVGALVEASIREDGEQHRFEAAASEQLFQVDSKGGADQPLSKKQKMLLLQKDPLVKSRKFDAAKASKGMLATVEKMKAVSAQQAELAPAKTSSDAVPTAKVWGSDGTVEPPAEHALLDEYIVPAVVKKVKRRKLVAPTAYNVPKVEVAAPGQSYHPEFAAHQDVMAEAVAKELERREKIVEMAKPVAAGMSEETLQYIDTRGSDEESASEAEDADAVPTRKKKVPELVTRSQRNKRSRHKQMELEHQQRRQEKSIIKQINAANHILQDIIRDEKASEQKLELKKVLEEQKLGAEPELVRVAGKLTKVARETPVSFSEELTGNMRTLKPKGSLLLERFDSMHKRNLVQVNGPRSTRKRKVRIIEAKNAALARPSLLVDVDVAIAMGSLMRPNNFRHDQRGSRVVEVRMEEYERSKRSILKTIRFRLVVLGVLMAVFAVVAFTLGIVVRAYHMKIVKFQRPYLGVRLRDLYFVYGAGAIAFGLHGFYVDGNWNRLQLDGSHLVMHVRLYSLLGLGTWLLALWLGAATLSSFGLVEITYIARSSPNLIYLSTLVTACLHMLVSPWLLRTIHRKGSQADEYFGAEFMADLRRPSQRVAAAARGESDSDSEGGRRDESVGSEAKEDSDDGGVGGAGDTHSRRANYRRSQHHRRSTSGTKKQDRTGGGGQKSRKAFYNADGTATVAVPPSAPSSSSPRPRSAMLNSDSDGQPALSVATAVAVATASQVTDPGEIPFASPVFVLDREARLQSNDFWRLWKQLETTGSFSCSFANEPTKRGVAEHLRVFGFHVVACDARDGVLQAYFYAQQLGAADVVFLCEFVLISARRFFQATFKCQDRAAAADFVARFNLQELLRAEERE